MNVYTAKILNENYIKEMAFNNCSTPHYSPQYADYGPQLSFSEQYLRIDCRSPLILIQMLVS